jgi:hypothetical protein
MLNRQREFASMPSEESMGESHAAGARARWLDGLVLGTVAGAVILGAGGRVAMRGVSILQEWTPYFTVEGSMTVVFTGAAAGAAGSVLLLALCAVPRLPGWGALGLFWLAVGLVTMRVIQPFDRERLLMFPPVVLVYGVGLLVGVRWLAGRRPARRPATPAPEAPSLGS